MNILIAGATGLIGRGLVHTLKQHHQLTVLGRDKKKLAQAFPEHVTLLTWDELNKIDAKHYEVIINLCGHNIAASRWTEAVKQKLITSRMETSTTLINWAITHQAKPRFFCANAVGIYGIQQNGDPHAFDENSLVDLQSEDFLSEIGIRWQQPLQQAIDYGMQVITLRFGVVLKHNEGMLKKLMPSFKFGLGAIVGDGQQVISWVDIHDVTSAVNFLLERPQLTGPFNITSPNPVSQKEFAQTLAKLINRPLILKMPALAIKLLFGEMGYYLLLRGQRVLPTRLQQEGYQFSYPNVDDALRVEVCNKH